MINHTWMCPCCGEEQVGLIDSVAYNKPDPWFDLNDSDKKRSKLGSDMAILRVRGEADYYFIRCTMYLPIKVVAQSIMFGVWASVSKKSFKMYKAGYKRGKYSEDGCFGFLANSIFEFDQSYGLPADIDFGDGTLRPTVLLHEAEYDLFTAQQKGVEPTYLERITLQMSAPHKQAVGSH